MHRQSFKSIFRSLNVLVILLGSVTLLSAGKWGKVSAELYFGNTPDCRRLQELKRAGVRTLINVRTNPTVKTAESARKLGFRYVHIRTGVVRKPDMKMIDRYLRIICNPANRPVYVFCQGGRDRTSFYVALYKMARCGCTSEEASEYMRTRRLRLWWPTFKRYQVVLEKHEKQIKQLAAQYERNARSRIAIHSRRWSQNSHRTTFGVKLDSEL